MICYEPRKCPSLGDGLSMLEGDTAPSFGPFIAGPHVRLLANEGLIALAYRF